MPEIPSLALARIIVRAYQNDDFHPIIVYGDLRIGKSAYTIKAIEQALSYLGWLRNDKLDAHSLQHHMGWEPEENVETWLMNEEREPVFCWDDAGYWLHSLNWTDPVLISIQQYMNVIGTDYNTFIMTTPDPTWILSKIANMAGMIRVKVVKRTGTNLLNDTQDYRRFARKGIGYKPWKSPDLKRGGVNKILEDQFSCKLDEELYSWYKPVRDEYAKRAKLQILHNLRQSKQASSIQEMKQMRTLKRLEKQLFKKIENKKVGANVEVVDEVEEDNL